MLDILRDNAQSWGIKIIFAIIILAFIFAFANPGGGGDTVMAYVNDQPITVADFERLLNAQEDRSVETRQGVLGTMARNELIRQMTEANGIVVPDAELRAYIRNIPAFMTDGAFDKSKYKAAVGAPENFETQTRDELLKAKMARFLSLPAYPSEAEVRSIFTWQNEQTSIEYTLISTADYLSRVIIEPAAVQKYYEENNFLYLQPERAVFDYISFSPSALADASEVTEEEIESYSEAFAPTLNKPRTATYGEIVIPVGETPTQESVDAATVKAKTILEKIAAGATFEEMAKAYARPGDMTAGALKVADMSTLPDAVATALNGLEVGGISQFIPTIDGLTIVTLKTIEEARPLTLDESRPLIVQRLAEEKGSKRLDDTVEEAIAAISQGKDLAGAAELLGLPLMTTKPLTDVEFKQTFPMAEETVTSLFAMLPGDPTTVPVLVNDGYILAVKTQNLPSMTLPIEDVRGEIQAKLMLQEAAKLAALDAQTVLTGTVKDMNLAASELFTRSGPIPIPGINQRILTDAFTVEPGQWLPAPYQVPDGYVVAKAKERIEPAESTWEEERDSWMQTAGEIGRRELNMAFQAQVYTSADENNAIRIVRGDLLQ